MAARSGGVAPAGRLVGSFRFGGFGHGASCVHRAAAGIGCARAGSGGKITVKTLYRGKKEYSRHAIGRPPRHVIRRFRRGVAIGCRLGSGLCWRDARTSGTHREDRCVPGARIGVEEEDRAMRMTAHEVCGGSIAEPVLRSARMREPGAAVLARGGREDVPGVSNEGLTSTPASACTIKSRAEPSRAEPSRAEPSRAEPSRATVAPCAGALPGRGPTPWPAPHPGGAAPA